MQQLEDRHSQRLRELHQHIWAEAHPTVGSARFANTKNPHEATRCGAASVPLARVYHDVDSFAFGEQTLRVVEQTPPHLLKQNASAAATARTGSRDRLMTDMESWMLQCRDMHQPVRATPPIPSRNEMGSNGATTKSSADVSL